MTRQINWITCLSSLFEEVKLLFPSKTMQYQQRAKTAQSLQRKRIHTSKGLSSLVDTLA